MKEKRLKKELRILGYSPEDAAKICGVSHQSMNNYISARTPIKPIVVRKLIGIGISKTAIRNPSEMV